MQTGLLQISFWAAWQLGKVMNDHNIYPVHCQDVNYAFMA